MGPPAYPAEVLPVQQLAAEAADVPEGMQAGLENGTQDAVPAPLAEEVLQSGDAEMTELPEGGSTEAGDAQPVPSAPETIADMPVKDNEGDAAMEPVPEVDASMPAEEVPHDDGAVEEQEAAEEDKEWPPKGSMAAGAALLPGRTQYVRKVRTLRRQSDFLPCLKRCWLCRS